MERSFNYNVVDEEGRGGYSGYCEKINPLIVLDFCEILFLFSYFLCIYREGSEQCLLIDTLLVRRERIEGETSPMRMRRAAGSRRRISK